MKPEQRNLYQSFQELAEQYWRDWDHKTRHEWKLSFGYWARRFDKPCCRLLGLNLWVFMRTENSESGFYTGPYNQCYLERGITE